MVTLRQMVQEKLEREYHELQKEAETSDDAANNRGLRRPGGSADLRPPAAVPRRLPGVGEMSGGLFRRMAPWRRP